MNKTDKTLPYSIRAGTYRDCYFMWNSTDPDELDKELGMEWESYQKLKFIKDRSQFFWKGMSNESHGFHKELRNE